MPQELLSTPALHQTQCVASVRKIKEILHLKDEAGLSNRAIAGVCKISNSTVGECLRRAEAAGVCWPLGELSEGELYQKLFGDPPLCPKRPNRCRFFCEARTTILHFC
jgi:hypothetical protein